MNKKIYPEQSRRKRILIIEDSPTISEIIKDRLEFNGFEILQAFDGKQGLEMAKSEKPDLIILDVKMPVMDGIEVCKRIKADAEVKEIPVIIYSALTRKSDIQAGLAAGAEDYLTKPNDPKEIVKQVRKYLKEDNANAQEKD